MQESLDIATDPWGIKVTRVELKNIEPPAAIQEAMEKQMKQSVSAVKRSFVQRVRRSP